MRCPLCLCSLQRASAEAHLRRHLRLAAQRCFLCSQTFFSAAAAAAHLAAHPPSEGAQLAELEAAEEDEARLAELLRLAQDPSLMARRVCLCGRCQLHCQRERAELPPDGGEGVAENLIAVKSNLGTSSVALQLQESSSSPSKAYWESFEASIENKPAEQRSFEQPLEAEDSKPLTESEVNASIADEDTIWNPRPADEVSDALEGDGSDATFESHDEERDSSPGKRIRNREAESPRPRFRCSACGKRVLKNQLKKHISTAHLQRPLHRCRLCDYASQSWAASDANTHVRKVHFRRPGPEVLDSSEAASAEPLLRSMVPELFGARATDFRPPKPKARASAPVPAASFAQLNTADLDFESPDGRATCQLCSRRVLQQSFRRHALAEHGPHKYFACRLCPYAAKAKFSLLRHLAITHRAEPAEENWAFRGTAEEARELTSRCFGAAASHPRLRCVRCAKLVFKTELAKHVSVAHFRRVLHRCRLCDYASVSLAKSDVNAHVRSRHALLPGPHTVDSQEAKRLAPVLRSLIPDYFPRHR